ncbi:MAG TPA: PorV/PorQ family protein [Bacteroidales bacterium]|nr:PorV/PorQ family protein [Bacteroidales bacterium]
MKNLYRYLAALTMITALFFATTGVQAGNKDRSGQAGAPELLINPWTGSAGWGGVNTSNIRGVESMFANIAGLAFVNKLELGFSQTYWLKGSGIGISNFGLGVRAGETGAIGISVFSMRFGDLDVTTTEQPDGTGATYSPSLLNFALSYSKTFSNSIYAGLTIRIISESIPDASAQGICLDAGVMYVTGERDQAKFGIALRNLGPTMKFTGDGFSIKAFFQGNDNSISVIQRSESFELPTQLRIGASYDFQIAALHRLTLAGNFTSNSFSKDQFTLGLEYSLNEILMLRGAYTYEDGILEDVSDPSRTNAYKGLSLGASVEVPLSKKTDLKLGIDYAYQSTDNFKGTQAFGIRIKY